MNATSRALARVVGLSTLVFANHSFAADTDCKPLFEAITRLFNTPNHEYLSQTNAATGDEPIKSEIINTGAAMYIKVEGKWHNSTATGAELQAEEETNRKNAKVTSCKVLQDETIDGVAVTLYSAHTETAYGISNEQIWIAKGTGLPVRETIDMDLGQKGGKSRADIHVVYVGIEAPVVAAADTASK
jgi:hypothetical protein